jgi:hypothetical protein
VWATVGRFRCHNSSCPGKIFCERLPWVRASKGAPNGAGRGDRAADQLRGGLTAHNKANACLVPGPVGQNYG